MNVLTSAALKIATSFIGTVESGGNNRGPLIEQWLTRVYAQPGDAWCAAFAWCCVDDALKLLSLPNPIRPCASVVRLWSILPDGTKSSAPVPGCWAFHRDPENPHLGHLGFIEFVDGDKTYSIEGNTNAEGSRTGGGVWRHTPAKRPPGYWNIGFADYSAAAAICLPPLP